MNRQCPKCHEEGGDTSHDNLVKGEFIYHCFACGYKENIEDGAMNQTVDRVKKETTKLFETIPINRSYRGISPKTFAYYNTAGAVGTDEKMISFITTDELGNPIHQKLRSVITKSNMSQRGDQSSDLLFGLNLFSPQNSRFVTITFGEYDALAVYESTGYATCSVKKGDNAAYKEILSNLETLQKYPYVVLWPDNDESCRKVIEKITGLFDPGKIRVVNCNYKDANEALLDGSEAQVKKLLWSAKEIVPDSITIASDIDREDFFKATPQGIELPYKQLSKMIQGLGEASITTIIADTGVGKSTMMKEIGYHLLVNKGLRVGNLFLEEGQQYTGKSYFAIRNNVPAWRFDRFPEIVDAKKLDEDWDVIMNDRLFFFNHFGSIETDNLISKLNYLAHTVDVILLDHISIAVSGLETMSHDDRKHIDILMTKLRTLTAKTKVRIVLASHIKKIEREGKLSLVDIRGSGSIGQISDTVLALDKSSIHVLKNRTTGMTGFAGGIVYNDVTGRLLDKKPEGSILDKVDEVVV